MELQGLESRYQNLLIRHLATEQVQQREVPSEKSALDIAVNAARVDLEGELGRSLSPREIEHLNKLTQGFLSEIDTKPRHAAGNIKRGMVESYGAGLEGKVADNVSTAVEGAQEVGALGVDPVALAESYVAVSKEIERSQEEGVFLKAGNKASDLGTQQLDWGIFGVPPAFSMWVLSLGPYAAHGVHAGLARLFGGPKGGLTREVTSDELQGMARRFQNGSDVERAMIGRLAADLVKKIGKNTREAQSGETPKPYLTNDARELLTTITTNAQGVSAGDKDTADQATDAFIAAVNAGWCAPHKGVEHLRHWFGKVDADKRAAVREGIEKVAETYWPAATRELLKTAALGPDTPQGRLESIKAEIDLYQRNGFLLNRKLDDGEVEQILNSIKNLPADEQPAARDAIKGKLFDSDGKVRKGYKFVNTQAAFGMAEALRA